MDLIFSENEKETSSGYALSGGNPALKDLAVPAGLFFLQKTLQNQPSNYKNGAVSEMVSEMVSETLYERLLGLASDTSNPEIKKRTATKKIHNSGKKNQKKKTKKNK